MSSAEDKEKRFSHLLQPIRDLAQNWSIDVAAELEEYLDELEHITISFDGGKTSLNFAEAALLIQGSACIYSKKVEYLYTLIYETLDKIAERKRTQLPTSINADGRDADVEWAEEELMALDDMLEEANNIDLDEYDDSSDDESDEEAPGEAEPGTDDLPEEEANIIRRRGGRGGRAGQSRRKHKSARNIRQVMASTPLSRLSARSFAADTGGNGEHSRESFRLSTASIHHSGALLLDGDGGEGLMNLSIDPIPLSQSLAVDNTAVNNISLVSSRPSIAPVHAGQENITGDISVFDGDDDIGGGIGGFDDFDDSWQGQGASRQSVAPKRDAHGELDAWAQLDAGIEAKPTAGEQSVDGTVADVDDVNATAIGTYKPSDFVERPFRKGRTWKAPADAKAIAKYGARAEKGVQPGDIRQKALDELRFSGKTVITAAPFSAAMGYVFGLVQKQRSRVRLAQAKANASLSRAGTASVAAKRLSHVYDADAPGAFDDFDDDDIGGGVGGFDDDGFAEAAAHSVAAGEARDNFEAADDDAVAVSLSRAFEANAARDVDTSQTYEELCKAHIEAYAASTQKYLLQTQLSKRVNDWREKIEPILEEEAARSEFNIHSYGDRIIHSLLEAAGADSAPASAVEDEEVEAKFDDIVGTTEVYEVCRMFLASLQLANSGSVELIHDGPTLDHDHPLRLRLLSAHNAAAITQICYNREEDAELAAAPVAQVIERRPARGADILTDAVVPPTPPSSTSMGSIDADGESDASSESESGPATKRSKKAPLQSLTNRTAAAPRGKRARQDPKPTAAAAVDGENDTIPVGRKPRRARA